ncbi:MAG: cupin [Candidatus Shapirobacteria bacterium]
MITSYQQKISKPWGWELILTPPSAPVTGKILFLKAGCRFSWQYHDQKEESLTLLTGRAKIILEHNEEEMKSKRGYLIKNGQKHRCQAISDCEIMEVSTPEKGRTIRLQDDYRRGSETEELRQRPNRGWEEQKT